MSLKKRPIRYTNASFWFFKRTIATPAARKYNVQINASREVKNLEGPFILLGNHVDFWDPFWLNHGLDVKIHYIVSDFSWRNPFRAWFLDKVGSIPKAKSVSDIRTIKGILQVIKDKGAIGLFPEGIRSWEGRTLPLFFSAAKLIKKLKIPVVTGKIQGGFFTRPRWTKKHHKGKVLIDLNLAYTPEELEKVTEQQIYDHITRALEHDEVAFQEKAQITYKGKHKAYNMEFALFTCPLCGTIGQTYGKGNTFTCRHCDNTIQVNDKWFFEAKSEKDKLKFNNIRDWFAWQVEDLESRIKKHFKTSKEEIFLSDPGCILFSTDENDDMKEDQKGTAALNAGFVIITNEEKTQKFALKDLKGVNVQDLEKLEFKVENRTYRLDFDHPVSGIKWKKAINFFKEIQGISEPAQVTGL